MCRGITIAPFGETRTLSRGYAVPPRSPQYKEGGRGNPLKGYPPFRTPSVPECPPGAFAVATPEPEHLPTTSPSLLASCTSTSGSRSPATGAVAHDHDAPGFPAPRARRRSVRAPSQCLYPVSPVFPIAPSCCWPGSTTRTRRKPSVAFPSGATRAAAPSGTAGSALRVARGHRHVEQRAPRAPRAPHLAATHPYSRRCRAAASNTMPRRAGSPPVDRPSFRDRPGPLGEQQHHDDDARRPT